MSTRNLLGVFILGVFACGVAVADFVTGFEPPTYAGSAGGTITTGQDGWYVPVVGSADHMIFTYVGNAWGFPDNPADGGTQFDAGQAQGGSAYARAQRDVDFSRGAGRPSTSLSHSKRATFCAGLGLIRGSGKVESRPNATTLITNPTPE